MIRIVCNSSPIIGLSAIGKLNLLWELFDEVMIPEEVYREVKKYLDKLIDSNYPISKKLYENALAKADELNK